MNGLWYLASLVVFVLGWIIFLDGKEMFRLFGVVLLNTALGVIILAFLGFPTDRETLFIFGVIASILQIGIFIFFMRKFFSLDGGRLYGMVGVYTFATFVFNVVSV